MKTIIIQIILILNSDVLIRFMLKELLTQAVLGSKYNKRESIHSSQKVIERITLSYLPRIAKHNCPQFRFWYLIYKLWLFSLVPLYCVVMLLIISSMQLWLWALITVKIVIIINVRLQFDSSRRLKWKKKNNG